METFSIPNSPKRRKGFLLARWSIRFFLMAVGYFVIDSVWSGSRYSATDRVIQALIFSALFCAVGVIWQVPTIKSLTIDGDMVVFKKKGSFHKMFLGNIRTVVETKGNLFRDGGLMVSEKSLFKARLWGGFLWIPEWAPEYAYFKNVIAMRKNSVH